MSALPPPHPALRACVVVPARDEAGRIAACIDALAGQEGVPADAVEVLLVLDSCEDDTAARALAAAARHPLLRLHLLESGTPGAGATRRRGMDAAAERLEALGREDGLIASTDADTRAHPGWLRRQLDLIAAGAQAVGGLIVVDADGVPASVLRRRETRLGTRLEAVHPGETAEHPFFSGASLGITVAAYRHAGGLRPIAALEDQALERTLTERGVPITRSRAVRVTTSGRIDGRARHGLSADLRIDAWTDRRNFVASRFDARALAEAKAQTVSVVLPCRQVAATVGTIVDALDPLRALGLIDEVLVIDAASPDGTAEVAARHGARVVQESEVMPEFGPCRGKGDAMWRALSVAEGEIVAYIDADTIDFDPMFAVGLLGPLLTCPDIALVKGTFRRPLRAGDALLPDEGGRVTELMARPLLSVVAPELGGFAQPLAGETAGRRDLLESLPFPVGYGIETAMLIDALRARGLEALAQVDLGTRLNRHQPLRELAAMSLAVLGAGLRRGLPEAEFDALAPGRMRVPTAGGGVEVRDVALDERPPLAGVRQRERLASSG